VVFYVAGQMGALPLEDVERIIPMAHLARPHGLPAALEGILNLAGTAVPVLRLARLLGLPAERPGLYSMLMLLNGIASTRVGMLVDRVSDILSVPESEQLPVGEEHSFNGCATAIVPARGGAIHLLSGARILLEQERESLAEFQTIAQRRIEEWSVGKQ
jgi:purine-binding chemotaxis protein CheW